MSNKLSDKQRELVFRMNQCKASIVYFHRNKLDGILSEREIKEADFITYNIYAELEAINEELGL